MSPITRRQLLARTGLAGAAIIGAGGAGAAVAALADLPGRASAPSGPSPVASPSTAVAPPQQLVSALARERALVATAEAAQAATPGLAVLASIAADHRSHADALAAAIGSPSGPTASPSSSKSALAGTGSVATLLAAERAAQQVDAVDSAKLRGSDAVLLASIAACEAGHVELLT